MMDASSDFARYFPIDTVVSIGIHFDNAFLEGSATIIAISGDTARLELPDDCPADFRNVPSGSGMVITGTEAWCVSRCRANISNIAGNEIRAQLLGPIEVQQRREFFRWDVSIPVVCSIPADQQLTVVRQEWDKAKIVRRLAPPPVIRPTGDGFRVYRGRKRKSVNPVRVNLSGSGIRIPTAEELLPGTLSNLEIYLPLIPARVIIAVGAVIRSSELQLTHHTAFPYLTAFRFEFIDERDRDTIISYLFMEQRNLLRQQADERADHEFPPEEAEEVDS